MKTTGLEAVLNALRGEAGLSGADKKDGGENAAFLAAFDAAARSAGEKPEVNGPLRIVHVIKESSPSQ